MAFRLVPFLAFFPPFDLISSIILKVNIYRLRSHGDGFVDGKIC